MKLGLPCDISSVVEIIFSIPSYPSNLIRATKRAEGSATMVRAACVRVSKFPEKAGSDLPRVVRFVQMNARCQLLEASSCSRWQPAFQGTGASTVHARKKFSVHKNVVFESETCDKAKEILEGTRERHGKWNNAIQSKLTTTEASVEFG